MALRAVASLLLMSYWPLGWADKAKARAQCLPAPQLGAEPGALSSVPGRALRHLLGVFPGHLRDPEATCSPWVSQGPQVRPGGHLFLLSDF